MQVFENLSQFQACLGNARKWERTLEAIKASEKCLPGVTYSVGDSLTWLKVVPAEKDSEDKKPILMGTQTPSLVGNLADDDSFPSEIPIIFSHRQDSDTSALVASRRYLLVIYCHEGRSVLEWAPVKQLRAVTEYSDLSDRQYFELPRQTSNIENDNHISSLRTLVLDPGNLVIFDISEAVRINPSSVFTGVTLRVTVEENFFHNK